MNEQGGPIDEFVFTANAVREIVQAVENEQAEGRIRFATRLVGGWNLLTAHEINRVLDGPEPVLALMDLARDSVGVVALITDSAVCYQAEPDRVKRQPPCRFEAFIRVKLVEGFNRVQVREALRQLDGYCGSCLVEGSNYEILLEVGAETESKLSTRVQLVRDTAGVRRPLDVCLAEFDSAGPGPCP
jgi:hypothetical protein